MIKDICMRDVLDQCYEVLRFTQGASGAYGTHNPSINNVLEIIEEDINEIITKIEHLHDSKRKTDTPAP